MTCSTLNPKLSNASRALPPAKPHLVYPKNRKVVGADDPHSGVLRRSRVDPEHAANVNPQTTPPAPHTRYLKKLVDARYAHAECPAFATARP